MTAILFTGSVIGIACIASNRISHKLGVPILFLFILIGILFGSDGFVKIPFDNFTYAEHICSTALIFIMFYGGFGTSWKAAKPVAAKAFLLSSLGVIITAGLTGLFCHFVLKLPVFESFLIGSVLSSTDAASVFSILRSKKLNLKDGTASMLEVESGSNDPFSYMLTIILLGMMNGKFSGAHLILSIFAQLAFGIMFGVLVALFGIFVLRRVRFFIDGFDAIFVLTIAVLSYSLPAMLGGNGFLSTYICGIIMGNVKLRNKNTLVHFFDGITGLMQMVIFFLLGLLSFPSQIPKILLPSIAIAVFLTFIARPIAVFAILAPTRSSSFRQQLLVSWAGLRGAASIVFAIIVTVNGAGLKNDIFHIVFCIVLLSISLQGTLLSVFAKKLNMIDDNANVLKTFTDYKEEEDLQFVKLVIEEGHPWLNSTPKDLVLPPNTLLVMLIRGNDTIIPRGNTIIKSGDIAVLSAPGFNDEHNIQLQETKIYYEHEWVGQKISDIDLDPGTLIIMVKRQNHVIVPNGNIKIKAEDIVVFTIADEN